MPSKKDSAETLAQPAYNKNGLRTNTLCMCSYCRGTQAQAGYIRRDGPTKVSYNYGNSEGNQVEPVYNRGDRRMEEFLIKGISGRALEMYNIMKHQGSTEEDTIYVKNSRKVRPRALITNLTQFETVCRSSTVKDGIRKMISNIKGMNPRGDTRMFVCRSGLRSEPKLEFVCLVVHLYMSEYGATCDYSISTYSYKQQKKTNKLAKKPENSKKSSSTNLDYISAFCDSKRAQSSANPQDAISSEGSQSPTSTNYSRKDEQFIDNYLLEANFIDKLVESGFAEMENSQLYMITED